MAVLSSRSSLPHACGGVSLLQQFDQRDVMSSPRLWGCFRLIVGRKTHCNVFPTPVGVFPTTSRWLVRALGLPHACGGVSVLPLSRTRAKASSPRLWGCFSSPRCRSRSRIVFPTPVGVFLSRWCSPLPKQRLPHACGGVSSGDSVIWRGSLSSPRLWGCFYVDAEGATQTLVFPTPVGVFLDAALGVRSAICLPHACGGVSKR